MLRWITEALGDLILGKDSGDQAPRPDEPALELLEQQNERQHLGSTASAPSGSVWVSQGWMGQGQGLNSLGSGPAPKL